MTRVRWIASLLAAAAALAATSAFAIDYPTRPIKWIVPYPPAGTTDVLARIMAKWLSDHLGRSCIGQVAEVFDAEEPFTPRGCVAQAWGVAELLRALDRASDRPRAPASDIPAAVTRR